MLKQGHVTFCGTPEQPKRLTNSYFLNGYAQNRVSYWVCVPSPSLDPTSNWITTFDRLKIHVVAYVLRLYVWYISGDGVDFDRVTTIETPGLGSGQARCAICLPRSSVVASEAKPLILVFEGGGFILGQPEDGQQHDRRLSDEVGSFVS